MTRVRRLVSTIALSSALPSRSPAVARRRRGRARAAAAATARGAGTAAATASATAAAARRRRRRRPLTEEEVFARKSVDQLNAEKPLDDVFFDLDQADVRDDAKPALQKDADWMKKWASVQVTLEGHCDSRGSAEYNLGLGSRRATRGEGLPGQPGRARGPRHRGQQGQGAAVLQRGERRPAGSRTGAGTS